MRRRMGEVGVTGWCGQKEPSLVQLNYRVIQTERTEPGSTELPGDIKREPSLVQLNYRAIQTERTEVGSSELPGDTERTNPGSSETYN